MSLLTRITHLLRRVYQCDMLFMTCVACPFWHLSCIALPVRVACHIWQVCHISLLTCVLFWTCVYGVCRLSFLTSVLCVISDVFAACQLLKSHATGVSFGTCVYDTCARVTSIVFFRHATHVACHFLHVYHLWPLYCTCHFWYVYCFDISCVPFFKCFFIRTIRDVLHACDYQHRLSRLPFWHSCHFWLLFVTYATWMFF